MPCMPAMFGPAQTRDGRSPILIVGCAELWDQIARFGMGFTLHNTREQS